MFLNGKLVSDKCNSFTSDQNYYYVVSYDQFTKIGDLERWILHLFDVNGDNADDDIKDILIDEINEYSIH